jgi:hypothetical protein
VEALPYLRLVAAGVSHGPPHLHGHFAHKPRESRPDERDKEAQGDPRHRSIEYLLDHGHFPQRTLSLSFSPSLSYPLLSKSQAVGPQPAAVLVFSFAARNKSQSRPRKCISIVGSQSRMLQKKGLRFFWWGATNPSRARRCVQCEDGGRHGGCREGVTLVKALQGRYRWLIGGVAAGSRRKVQPSAARGVSRARDKRMSWQ